MKLLFVLLFFANSVLATQLIKPSKQQEQIVASGDGINFTEWESEFDTSMKKAKVRVQKCEAKNKNCQFEKFQALDPSFDVVQ